MVKALKFLIFSFVLILICGCSDKKALDKEQITTKLSNEGFIVSDITLQMEDENVTCVLVANNSKYNIEYYRFKDKKLATEAYENNKKAFEKYKSNGKETQKDTYKKYTQELSDTYNSLTVIDNTLIYASINIEYKSDLKSVLKNIGY